jgi:hypothetical protein
MLKLKENDLKRGYGIRFLRCESSSLPLFVMFSKKDEKKYEDPHRLPLN